MAACSAANSITDFSEWPFSLNDKRKQLPYAESSHCRQPEDIATGKTYTSIKLQGGIANIHT